MSLILKNNIYIYIYMKMRGTKKKGVSVVGGTIQAWLGRLPTITT